MRFHITYSPLGSLLAYHLRQALNSTHHITLVHATQTLASKAVLKANGQVVMEHAGVMLFARQIRSEPLSLEPTPSVSTKNQKLVSEPTRRPYKNYYTLESLPQPDEPTPIDSLIVTSPPTHTLETIRYLIPRLSVKSTIVLMQTGLGVYEHIMSQLFPNPDTRPHFILAQSNHHVWLKTVHHAVHTRVGDIKFVVVPDPKGHDFESALREPKASNLYNDFLSLRDIPQLADYATLYNTVASLRKLRALRVRWIPMEEGELLFRRDTFVRSIVEALAVLLNCSNGEVFNTQEASFLATTMCREATTAFEAQWVYEIQATKVFAPNTPLPQLPVVLRKRSLMSKCIAHSIATAQDLSPMLRDLRKGAPTQIEYGLGYFLAIGQAYDVAMPMTWSVYKIIKAREAIVEPMP